MKKRKIWVSIALASACLFSLAACGKTEESTPTPTPTATATPTPTATPTATPSVPSSSVAPTSTYDPTSPLDVCYDVTFDNYIGETVPSTGLKTKNVTLLQTNMSLDGMDVSYDGTTYKRISNIKGSKASPALKVNVPTEGKVTMIIAPQGTSDRTLTVTDGFGNALPVKKNGELVENGILPNGGSNSLFVLEVEVEDTTDICLSATNGYVLLDVKTEFSQIFGELEGIEVVNPGRSQYVVGMDYNPTKLLVKAVYENGEIFLNPDEFTIDTSGYNNSAAGTYTIKVVKDGKEDSFEVTVKSADALELELYSIAKGKNSKANNGQYITTNAKRIYKTSDEKIDTTALIPLAVSGTGADAIKSPLAIDEVSITGYTKGQAGKQTITVSYGSVSASYDIYVVDTEAYKNANNEYIVTVDGSYTGVVGAVDGTNGNMFTTIGQALEFVQDTTRVAASAKKVIKVAAGYYREKLEITAPNLTIEGAGSTKATYNKDQNYNATEFNAATVIEFDSLYGEIEQNGFVQVTDSTQTVSVRDTAENCVIKNLTISNAYNCKEYFDDKIGTTSEHRALAILIQADTFQMYNSSLLGYQDTIELFTGRQYIKDSYISGTTDFIFGTNNTTYFKNCEIHSIYNGSTDGGYINAFKGSNSGDSDYVQYGAIYDGCNFTADSADGRAVGTGDAAKTAIARPWAKYSAVAIINSNLGGHISKAAFANNNTKNQRYVAWGSDGPYPTTETVKYVEYNNDGDGKLTEAVTGMRMLTSTEAENYSKLSVIFGTTNGKVKYTDAWDPTAAPTEDDKTYYTFDNSEKASGTTVKLEDFVLNQESETKTKTVSGMTFDVTDGGSITKRTTDKNQDLVLTTGAKIKFNVAANTMVTISGYYSVDIDVNGSKTKAETFQKFYATATEVVITGGSGTSYFTSIVVNPNETAPEAAKLDEITVANANTKVLLNTPYTLGDTAVVTAHYDDGSYKVLETSEYTVNTDAVHADTAGTYDVVVSFGGKSKTISVQYAESFDTTIRKSVGVTFKGGTYTTSGQGYTVVGLEDAIDASSADVNIANFIIHGAKSNSGNKTNWLAFNTGNTITLTVDRACTLEIGFYANGTTKKASDLVTVKLGDATITTTDTVLNKGAGDIRQYVITGAGTIVITAVANDYLGFVGVNVPKNLAEKKADAIAALEAKYPAATYSKNTSYATVLAAQEEAINNAADDEALSNAETAAEGAMAALKTNEQIDAETVVSIAVTNTPTSVAKDGTPDYTNVVVTATFADNHEAQLASDKYEFSVIDTSTTDDKTVTVTVIGTTVTENFTINVVETVQTYTITYHTTVGTAPEQETDVTALPTTLPQLVDSADVNMFVGWYTSETFTSENRALPGTNLAANADLYAYWVSLTEIKANIASALDNEYPTANYTTYKDEIDAAKAAAVTAITADSITTITEYETAAEAQAEILDAIPTDEQIADATTTYSFATNDSSKAADNFIVWDGTANATSLGALTISGNYHTNSNSFQAENTVTITFTVQDKTAVTFKGFSGYSEYQVDGRYAPDTYTKYYETGQTVTVVVTSGKYFVSIAINPLAKATEAATITGLTLSGTPDSNILVGTDLDLSGLKVKLNYSDNTYVNLTNTDYSVDTTSVNKTSPGTYPVTVTYAGVTPAITKTFNVTYAATVSNVIETNTTFVTGENNTALVAAATDNKIQSASVTVGKFTIDATASGACLRLNGGTNAQFYLGTRIEFTVAAGATVTVTGDTYAWGYKIGSETATERVTSKTYDTETTVVIESTSNDGYIDSIEITFA